MKNFKLFDVKPKMILCAAVIGTVIVLSGCSSSMKTTPHDDGRGNFDRAIARFGDSYEVVKINGYVDEGYGDTISLILEDGTLYYTNSSDTKLFNSESEVVNDIIKKEKIK